MLDIPLPQTYFGHMPRKNQKAITDDDLKSFEEPPETHHTVPTHGESLPLPSEISNDERIVLERALGLAPNSRGAFDSLIKMRKMVANKKSSVNAAFREIFDSHGVNPVHLLAQRIKRERGIIEVYERSRSRGVCQTVLDKLPQPDYDRYDDLLLKSMKFYTPALSNIEVSGQIDHALKINLVSFKKEERVIEHDELSPTKLLQLQPPVPEEGRIKVPLEIELEEELSATHLKAKR